MKKQIKVKLFTATVQCWNECYVETFIILAKSAPRAYKMMEEKRFKEHRNRHIVYKKPVTFQGVELEVEKEKIVSVYFGDNDSRGYDNYDNL